MALSFKPQLDENAVRALLGICKFSTVQHLEYLRAEENEDARGIVAVLYMAGCGK